MQPRIDNPLQTIPGTMEALQKLSSATQKAGVPATTHYLVELRASQINGCSICVDMHSRELKAAGEPDERINTVAAWRETPYFTDAERAALVLTIATINTWNRINAGTRQITGEWVEQFIRKEPASQAA